MSMICRRRARTAIQTHHTVTLAKHEVRNSLYKQPYNPITLFVITEISSPSFRSHGCRKGRYLFDYSNAPQKRSSSSDEEAGSPKKGNPPPNSTDKSLSLWISNLKLEVRQSQKGIAPTDHSG